MQIPIPSRQVSIAALVGQRLKSGEWVAHKLPAYRGPKGMESAPSGANPPADLESPLPPRPTAGDAVEGWPAGLIPNAGYCCIIPGMSKQKQPVTRAVRALRDAGIAFDGHPYTYVNGGGTRQFARYRF